jgi:predicted AAA+ superfamily ATPase
MEVKRDRYLNKLISYMWDGQVKVITGICGCGKSYLLHTLFGKYLLERGVQRDHILRFELDLEKEILFRNPLTLAQKVREMVEGKQEPFYLFVDEIQLSDVVPNPYNPTGKPIAFCEALNDLKSLPNLDIYVTSSNAKMLSGDSCTVFRGRSDEIRVHPLSFSEYYAAVGGDKAEAYANYAIFGGMPHILENIIYNELRIRDCAVDMGVVYASEKNQKGHRVQVAREINFLATLGGKKLYIQSAYALEEDARAETKTKPLCLTGDFFPKSLSDRMFARAGMTITVF